MSNGKNAQAITQSLENVEHPAIAATLLALGILRDIQVSTQGTVELTLVLPFPKIVENVRN